MKFRRAVYELLLRAHPSWFLERYRDELVEYFRDAHRAEAEGRGPSRQLAFWIRMISGTLRSGLVQRLRGRAPTVGGQERAGWTPRGTIAATMPRERREAMRKDGWILDARYALRGLLRRPTFAAIVVGTLALGVGANTAVFTVLDAVLIEPLPYPDSERLVRVYYASQEAPDARGFLSGPAAADLADAAEGFDGFGILSDYSEDGRDLTGGSRPERLRVLEVGPGYFEALGVEPVRGQRFGAEHAGGAPVALLRESLAERLSADDLGSSSVTLDDRSYRVIGVIPDGFLDPTGQDIQVWLPLDVRGAAEDDWDNNYLSAIGRTAQGVTLPRLRDELERHAERQATLGAEPTRRFFVVPLRDDLVEARTPLLLAVMAAVGLLLLLTCVNVTSLLAARSVSRSGEMAIRSALGCGRARLLRLKALEAAWLALGGALAGTLVGLGVLELILASAPPDLPRLGEVGFDRTSLGFVATLTVAIALVIGTGSTLAGRGRTRSPLTRSGAPSPSSRQTRSVLVAAEVALALVLLIGSGVLIRSVQRLLEVPLNLDAGGVVTFQVNLPASRYPDAPSRIRIHEQIREELRGLPSVRAAGAISVLPLSGPRYGWGTRRAHAVGEPFDTPNIQADQRVVDGDYFRALDIPLVQGRTFGPQDGIGAPYRVVVNRALVERLFGEEDPVGELVRVAGAYLEIVGVVATVPIDARGRTRPMVYHNYRQFAERNWAMIHVVDADATGGLVEAARQAVHGMDPDLVLHEPSTLESLVRAGTAADRFTAGLMSAFAALALLLASLGIYGVLAQAVGDRRHELGVRMALGADAGRVGWLVLRRALVVVTLGLGLGLVVATQLAGHLETLLFGVDPLDPVVFTVAPLALLLTAAVASFVPARRATRVDPVDAFRGH